MSWDPSAVASVSAYPNTLEALAIARIDGNLMASHYASNGY